MVAITIRRPDDWHVHFRQGDMLKAVVPYTAEIFNRVMVMPNTLPPITTRAMAREYRASILMSSVETPYNFTPLMTAYLTDDIDMDNQIIPGFENGDFAAVKLYPAHATTNSASGVTDWDQAFRNLAKMEKAGMPLLVHGEVTDSNVDIFDRERKFLDEVAEYIVDTFPQLKLVIEHITTAEAVEFVEACGPNVAATITAHHLVINRNDILVGGIRPHNYCLPIAKRSTHQQALRWAATSGNSNKFFFGSDSAPHLQHDKESACGCAGCFTAPIALNLLVQVFDEEGALNNLEEFTSINGAKFYGFQPNEETITLGKIDYKVPPPSNGIVPFKSGEIIPWTVGSIE